MKNLLIQRSDERFYDVFALWMSNIYYGIEELHPLAMNFAFTLGIGLSNVSKYDQNKDLAVKKDIQKIVKQNRFSDYSLVLVGYDPQSIQPARLQTIIDEISAKKRRKDYQMKCFAASEFTQLIDKHLFENFYTPDLSFVAIWFSDLSPKGVIYVDE